MKKITNQQYARALYEVTKDKKGKELNHNLARFVELLGRHHKLTQADRILNEFASYAKRQEGIVDIHVTSARQLDAAVLNQIKSVFGKQVEATQAVDESLFGGLIVKTGDMALDGSVRAQLRRLRTALST